MGYPDRIRSPFVETPIILLLIGLWLLTGSALIDFKYWFTIPDSSAFVTVAWNYFRGNIGEALHISLSFRNLLWKDSTTSLPWSCTCCLWYSISVSASCLFPSSKSLGWHATSVKIMWLVFIRKWIAEKQGIPTSYEEKIRVPRSFVGNSHEDGIGNPKTKINKESPRQVPEKPGTGTLALHMAILDYSREWNKIQTFPYRSLIRLPTFISMWVFSSVSSSLRGRNWWAVKLIRQSLRRQGDD